MKRSFFRQILLLLMSMTMVISFFAGSAFAMADGIPSYKDSQDEEAGKKRDESRVIDKEPHTPGNEKQEYQREFPIEGEYRDRNGYKHNSDEEPRPPRQEKEDVDRWQWPWSDSDEKEEREDYKGPGRHLENRDK